VALTAGTRLGPYEVTAQIGVGGMGEVYRATDTNLARQVAIKVLPEAVAANAERLARFDREAKTLAALNHPNIAAIYGLEKSAGTIALVMELVEGPTLADRIGQGPIPIDEALPIAKQIAEALEAAHEQGIIHRDLKPANVKVRPDGTVKVLDFGLAKAIEPTVVSPAGVTQSPTSTTPAMTQAGMILGSAAYMSPEQAKGRPADKRSDVWAFGCVLYEMLSGKRAFDGDDVAEALAAVLRGEPDWSALPRDVPPLVTALVRRGLRKDRRERVSDIGAALFALREASAVGVEARLPHAFQPRRWKHIVALLIVTAVAVGITSAVWWVARPSIRPPLVTRFTITLPEDQRLQATITPIVAISPDGSALAYMANSAEMMAQAMYLRRLSHVEATPIPIAKTGVENGLSPTFSPDGQSIVFYAGEKLKRIAVTGGTAVTLCDADVPSGISWGADGIVFGQGSRGIMRVSPDGGTPEVLVRVEPTELAASPQLLPDGDSLLFTLATAGAGQDAWDRARIVVQSLTSGERTTVVNGASEGRYLPTGHLVFAVGGVLFARSFSLDRLEVTGTQVPIVEGIRRGSGTGSTSTTLNAMQVAFSESGSLVYVPGPLVSTTRQTLVMADSKGNITPLKLPAGPYQFPRVSPNGRSSMEPTTARRRSSGFSVSTEPLSLAVLRLVARTVFPFGQATGSGWRFNLTAKVIRAFFVSVPTEAPERLSDLPSLRVERSTFPSRGRPPKTCCCLVSRRETRSHCRYWRSRSEKPCRFQGSPQIGGLTQHSRPTGDGWHIRQEQAIRRVRRYTSSPFRRREPCTRYRLAMRTFPHGLATDGCCLSTHYALIGDEWDLSVSPFPLGAVSR
jgi:eukaryotic-like serine/threonine-protein kinase